MLARVGRDRLGDRARAAAHEGPLRHLAVDLADVVVEQHVGRARRVRSAVGADRARHAARRLHLRRLEPLLEELGDRQRHHLDEVPGRLDVEALQLPGEARQLQQVSWGFGSDGRRGHQQQGPHELRDLRQVGAEFRPGLGVFLREFADLGVRLRRVLGQQQMRAVRKGYVIVRRERVESEAMPAQLQLVDDFGRHQGEHVGEGRDRIAWPGMLADGGAAQDGAPLQDEGFQARPPEVCRGRQAVVATADDNRVVFSRHPAEYIDEAFGQPSLDNRSPWVHICAQAPPKGQTR